MLSLTAPGSRRSQANDCPLASKKLDSREKSFKSKLERCEAEEQLKQDHGVVPGLAMILVGDRQDSKSYAPRPQASRQPELTLGSMERCWNHQKPSRFYVCCWSSFNKQELSLLGSSYLPDTAHLHRQAYAARGRQQDESRKRGGAYMQLARVGSMDGTLKLLQRRLRKEYCRISPS